MIKSIIIFKSNPLAISIKLITDFIISLVPELFAA